MNFLRCTRLIRRHSGKLSGHLSADSIGQTHVNFAVLTVFTACKAGAVFFVIWQVIMKEREFITILPLHKHAKLQKKKRVLTTSQDVLVIRLNVHLCSPASLQIFLDIIIKVFNSLKKSFFATILVNQYWDMKSWELGLWRFHFFIWMETSFLGFLARLLFSAGHRNSEKQRLNRFSVDTEYNNHFNYTCMDGSFVTPPWF